MTPKEIAGQLEAIKSEDDFVSHCSDLTASWEAANLGVDSIDPILRFIEENQIDFGLPGPLVRYVERWCDRGYEQKLVESIRRKPAPHTVWMLNRVINGTPDPQERKRFVEIMEGIRSNPRADAATLAEVEEFLSSTDA